MTGTAESNGHATEPIVLIAIFEARPSTRAELAARLAEMVWLTRPEPGCLSYELHVDSENSRRFIFLETWADAASLAAHDATPHVRAMVADSGRLTTVPLIVLRLRSVAA